MAITTEWDESTPTDAEAVSLGNERIQEIKIAGKERLRNGGHFWPVGPGTPAEAGIHAVSVPGEGGHDDNEFNIFRQDHTTKAFTVTDSGVDIPTGTLTVGGVSVLTNVASRFLIHSFPLSVGSGSNVIDTGGIVAGKINHHTFTFRQASGNATLTEFIVTRDDAPATGNLVFELRKLTPTWVADATVTILNSGGTNVLSSSFTLAGGAVGVREYGRRTTGFSDAVVAPGDTLYVATTGSDGTNLPFTCSIVMLIA